MRSDYALSKRLAVTPSEMSQYRQNRLRFPFAVVLDIADVMDIDPIEIIAGLEYKRCREIDKERVKRAYFKAHYAHFVYPNNPGFVISNVPSTPDLLRGRELEGKLILEVPAQVNPIPQSVLRAAQEENVIIRDTTGRIYK